MHSRLSHHLHTNNIWTQNGMIQESRKEVSTENAAFRLTDNAFKPINQKMYVEGIFCYLTKVNADWFRFR